MKQFLAITIFIVLQFGSFAQERTVGVTKYTEDVTEGLVFFCPATTNCYLVDECGKLVNEWNRTFRPGLAARMLENGQMLRTIKVSSPILNQASVGGGVEVVDWDNDILGQYIINGNRVVQHHDAIMLPNGNILLLAWEDLSLQYLQEMGSLASNLWSELVYEIKPINQSEYEIVWEWNLKNHLIQEVDSSLPNFMDISDNIGKVDINYQGPTSWGGGDRWHCNALDYNEELDQIIINSRNNSEAWIIDHSTTTEEAIGDTGGNSGKGGQILFRWGNPEAYDRGTEADLKMYGSHGLHWIEEGLPNAGKLLFFNNGDERPGFSYYSTVEMIQPVMEDNLYLTDENLIYFPLESELVYQAENPTDFYSTYLSNAQQLSNGNIFINEGGDSRFFEIDPSDNSIVWEYISPVYFGGFLPEDANPNNSRSFRAYKYERDFAGFEGNDLTGGSVLELGGDLPLECAPFVSISDSDRLAQMFSIFPNPLSNGQKLRITLKGEIETEQSEILISNAAGKQIKRISMIGADMEINMNDLVDGVYFITLRQNEIVRTQRFAKIGG